MAIDYGACVGAGWAPIVRLACMEIQALGGQILQVKEKFGGLRLYCAGDDGRVFDIADAAEKACEGRCEECGAPGELRGGGWIKTLCDEHEGKR